MLKRLKIKSIAAAESFLTTGTHRITTAQIYTTTNKHPSSEKFTKKNLRHNTSIEANSDNPLSNILPATSEKYPLSALINSINNQLRKETKGIKASKYAGYALGTLASAIVTPFSYRFGERFATSLALACDLDEEITKKAIGSLFAICSTLGVSAYSSFVCSNQFPIILSALTDKTLSDITRKNSLTKKMSITTTVALSTIVNIPGTYLNDQVYRPLIGESVVILDIANFIVWSTVSAWALYSIPDQAYKNAVSRYPSLSYSQAYTNRLKLLANIESVLLKARHMTDLEIEQWETALYADANANKEIVNEQWLRHLLDTTNLIPAQDVRSTSSLSGKDLAGVLGILVGFSASYFYVPAGMESGKFLAEIMNLKQAEDVFAYIVGPISFAIQGLTTALSARSCFMNSYDVLTNWLNSPHVENTSPKSLVANSKKAPRFVPPTFLITVLAFFASAHRAEITAAYAPDNNVGKFLIALSMFGLFSMNYWAFDGLKKQFFSPALSQSRQTFFSKVQSTKKIIEVADDRFLINLKGKSPR